MPRKGRHTLARHGRPSRRLLSRLGARAAPGRHPDARPRGAGERGDLDDLANPIVWDGLRTPLTEPVAPGERVDVEVAVRCPIPPGRYRFALDLVAERRAWFGEVGGEPPQREVEVLPRVEAKALDEVAEVHVPGWLEAASDWAERVLAAHREGYGVVAGSIEAPRRLRRALAPWAPGPGRVPGFSQPLLCPSVLRGIELECLPEVEGLPAFAPPPNEPWVYDGRIVLRWRPQ